MGRVIRKASTTSSRRMNKENMGPLLNGVGYLVTVDTEKAEVHSAAFASAFTCEVSWASGLKSRVQGGELPAIRSEIISELGTVWLESSFAEQDLAVLTYSKLNVSQQCAVAAKADSLLGCITRSSASKMSKGIICLTWHSLDHI